MDELLCVDKKAFEGLVGSALYLGGRLVIKTSKLFTSYKEAPPLKNQDQR